ncbi:hypothetical protein RND71_016448 [Anisodus tanguticus]|uniref:Protein EARLY FLOWERING 3 n=1 Tax=Anisodus tanguticus TaxID=243964 RepID=A0AAE1S8B5_9SOLA|nr:hypothetical protein RND71_016448 [Anisodus tanguticus]
MKRKGEEKVMGPMFPRLHVNDTEKGGPRAPPRNKMALYEQLCIPSQRFNSGVPNNTAKLGPRSSSQIMFQVLEITGKENLVAHCFGENVGMTFTVTSNYVLKLCGDVTAGLLEGNGHDRVVYFPVQHPPSRHLADKPPGHSSDPNTLLQQYELKNRTEEDDFTVPVFVNSKLGQANGSHTLDMEKLYPSGSVFSGRPNEELEGVTDLTLRQQPNSQNKENPKSTLASREKTTSNSASKECRMDPQVGCTVIPEPVKGIDDVDSYPMKEFGSEEQIITNDLIDDTESQEDRTCKSLQTRILDRGDDLSETSIVESISGTDISPDDVVGIIGLKRFWKARRAIVKHVSGILLLEYLSAELRLSVVSRFSCVSAELILEGNVWHDCRSCMGSSFDAESDKFPQSRHCRLRQPLKDFGGGSPSYIALWGPCCEALLLGTYNQFMEPAKSFCHPSVRVASINKGKATPEAESLVAIGSPRGGVQKLIAGSPNSTLEDSAYLGKPLKSSSGKTLPLDCIVRESQSAPKRKNDSEKPNFRMGYSAESTVGKPSLSSVQNGSQLSSHRPFSGNPLPTPVTNDSNAGPWCFQQPPGHQWLIPVMSPSEGLVYKPFPAPGFTSGPPGSTPTMGNFFAPTYGVPAPHLHYQGMGVPFMPRPPTGHGYVPQYGMPVMNPPISSSTAEESNQFTLPGLQRQLSGVVDNFNIQHEDSSSVLSEKNGIIPDVVRFQGSKDSEVQGSTASSPSERAHGTDIAEGRNMLSLFPTSPATDNPDSSPQACVPDHPAKVIKVVPHNARSATESVARIFQSIQQERKQYDSAFTHL